MSYLISKNIITAGLFVSLLLVGSAQASSNPFADVRPDSRLPSVAQDTSGKCAGMGESAEESGDAMQCGAGKCGAGMGDSAKPDAEPVKSGKCGGDSDKAMQCGGGGKCGGGK
jgi:hypothetical protein